MTCACGRPMGLIGTVALLLAVAGLGCSPDVSLYRERYRAAQRASIAECRALGGFPLLTADVTQLRSCQLPCGDRP